MLFQLGRWCTRVRIRVRQGVHCGEIKYGSVWNDASFTASLFYAPCEVYLTSAPSRNHQPDVHQGRNQQDLLRDRDHTRVKILCHLIRTQLETTLHEEQPKLLYKRRNCSDEAGHNCGLCIFAYLLPQEVSFRINQPTYSEKCSELTVE
jgi:hypothetical protein